MTAPTVGPLVWVHQDGRAVLIRWGNGPLLLVDRSRPEDINQIHPGSNLEDYRRLHPHPSRASSSVEERREWLGAAKALVDALAVHLAVDPKALVEGLADRIESGEPPPAELAGVFPPEDRVVGPDEKLADLLSADEGPAAGQPPAGPPVEAPAETDHPPHDHKSSE